MRIIISDVDGMREAVLASGLAQWIEGMGIAVESPVNLDPLKGFLRDCCEVDLAGIDGEDCLWVTLADLRAAYERWARDCGENPLAPDQFSERMRLKGFVQNRSRRPDGKQARTWEGLALLPEAPPAKAARGRGRPPKSAAVGSRGWRV